jgi:hypothetical protein
MQYNNLFALFENWDLYTKELNTSQNALGTLQKQQDTYMESTAAHLTQLKANAEDVYDSMFNSDTFKGVVDILSTLVSGLADFVDGVGGGENALMMLGSTALKVFGTDLSRSLATTVTNIKNVRENVNLAKAQLETAKIFGSADLNDPVIDQIVQYKKEFLDFGKIISEQQNNEINGLLKGLKLIEDQKDAYKEKVEAALQYAKQVNATSNNTIVTKNESDQFQLSGNATFVNVADKINEKIKSTQTILNNIENL